MKIVVYSLLFIIMGIPALAKFFLNVGAVYYIDDLPIRQTAGFLIFAVFLNHILERILWYIIYKRTLEQTNFYIYFVTLLISYTLGKVFILKEISWISIIVLMIINLSFWMIIGKFIDKGEEMRVLVTGFDPFGGEEINPSWEVVKSLPEEIAGAKVKSIQLPTVFEKSAEVLYKEIEEFLPDVVVCVGQAGGRVGITPERVAINIDDARIADNDGGQPLDRVIREDGQVAYFSSLPIKAIVENIKKLGIKAEVSNTAGTFVCNHIMYQALYYAEKNNPNLKAGFVHIPFLPEQVKDKDLPSMEFNDMRKGIISCIETIVEYKDKRDVQVTGGKEF